MYQESAVGRVPYGKATRTFFYHTQNCSFDIGFQVDPDTQHLTLILHLTRFEGKIMF